MGRLVCVLVPASTARTIGALLRERGETVSVAEGSAGGLISAALLSVPGEPSDSGSVPDTDGIRGFDVLVDQIELLVRPETSGTDVRVCRSDRS